MYLVLLPPQILQEYKQLSTKRTDEIVLQFWKIHSKEASGSWLSRLEKAQSKMRTTKKQFHLKSKPHKA